jgi:hypothetical protein
MKKSIKKIKRTIKSKKNKKNRKTRKTRKSKIKKGGQMGEINSNLFNNLPNEVKNNISNLLNNDIDISIENIKEKYENVKEFDLYDFIFDNNKKLIKIWFHGANNISSITGGLPGIHIYVIKKNDNNYEIIGKFMRN